MHPRKWPRWSKGYTPLMPVTSPVESLDTILVQAPVEEVFAIVVHPERRLQLHPNWGFFRPQDYSPDFPETGSFFFLAYPHADTPPVKVTVSGYVPNALFAYQVDDGRQTNARWEVAANEAATQVTYTETFIPEPTENKPGATDEEPGEFDELFGPQDRSPQALATKEVRLWLESLKRYAELRQGRLQLAMKTLMEKVFLQWRGDQRRIILGLLAFQMIMCLTFLCAAVSVGAARLILQSN